MTSTRPDIAVIIQARMGSSRLPGKVLMPLAGKPMLDWISTRVKRSRLMTRLVIATTDKERDDPVARLADDLDIDCIRGDETDVLARFVQAARHVECDLIVRLTGDNPFVDGELVDYLLSAYFARDPQADYANNVDGTAFPYGLYAEIFPRHILETAARESTDPDDREHVTRYFRVRPDEFTHQTIAAPGPFLYDNLTVDTPEQFREASVRFERHLAGNPNFDFRDLMTTAEQTTPGNGTGE